MAFVDAELARIWREYVERVESGAAVTPSDFIRRCSALRRRGLRDDLVADLRESGSVSLLRHVEASSPAQIKALNAAA